jgi:hypothetical protein
MTHTPRFGSNAVSGDCERECNARANSPSLRQAGFFRAYNGLDPPSSPLKSENTACWAPENFTPLPNFSADYPR